MLFATPDSSLAGLASSGCLVFAHAMSAIIGSGKIFAVGDIHGCHRQLTVLLDRLPCDRERDTLVFLGDYINRGPDSAKVIETLLQVRDEYRNTIFLLGNHEAALLDYAHTGNVELLRLMQNMGTEKTLESYGGWSRDLLTLDFLPDEHRAFLESLQIAWQTDSYVFVHADVPDGFNIQHMDDAARDRILSGRRLAREEADVGGRCVVFGHTPFASPLVMPGRIGIDTGAVYGGMLTAVELPSGLFHHS